MLSRVHLGSDPQAEKIEARSKATIAVSEVVETFLDRYAKAQTKEASAAETERLLKREIVKPWGKRRFEDITQADVHELLDEIVDRGAPIVANRTFAAFRRLSAWAVERGLIEASPCVGIRAPAAERSRDRVLSEAEIRLVWTAFERVGWPFGKIAQLLLLTGARRDEVGQMTWSEVDLDARAWTIPKERSKNALSHEVPLSDAAVEIMKTLPRAGDGKGFVFTTNGVTPVSGYSRAKANIDQAVAELSGGYAPERWTLHDLRRSAASGMAALGVEPHVIEAALNHRSGVIKGIAAIYNRHDYASEKRRALGMWGEHVTALVEGRERKIVPLSTKRAR